MKNTSRRKFIRNGLMGLGGLLVLERSYNFFSKSNAKGQIVIVGGGAAGITMAAYLSDMLKKSNIILIEPNENHLYQPGYTMLASGVFKPQDIVMPNSKLIPSGVKWIKDSVVELNPANNKLKTKNNDIISYDYIVLVPGGKMNFDLIDGISKETIGEGNAHCIYDFNGAKRCFSALQNLKSQKDARFVFTNTYSKIKCGGAPKKICLLTEDYTRRNNIREGKTFEFYSNSNNLMSPPVFGDRLATIYSERNINSYFKHRLVSIDTLKKEATFERIPEPTLAPTPVSANYKKVKVEYDFLHFVPPMSTPDFVKHSDITITEGKLKHGGWIDVDKETLIHKKYKNMIALGDAAGLPTSKTGAAIRMQAPIAARNLVALMEGKEPNEHYHGYTACPIVTEYGKVLMCEFGYKKELMPTIPWLDPGVERGMWWLLKKHGLKPMYYYGMLKGLM